MLMKFKVTDSDGERVVQVAPPDIVNFERTYKTPLSKMGDEFEFEWMCYLAWRVESRRKTTSLDFDAWTEQLIDIEPIADEDAEGKEVSVPAASTG